MKNIIEPTQNVDYDDVFETIYNDADKRGLSQDRVWEIWQAGIAAQQSVQRTAYSLRAEYIILAALVLSGLAVVLFGSP